MLDEFINAVLKIIMTLLKHIINKDSQYEDL